MDRILDFDELNRFAETLYEEVRYLPQKEKKKKSVDEVLELLVLAYILGWERIPGHNKTSLDKMFEAVYYLIDGKTFSDRIEEHIDNGDWEKEVIRRLVETEYHRCEETGAYDSAEEYEGRTGKRGYKRWETMKDNRVRDSHWYLEGTEVLLTGRFVTYDGDSAAFPGGFGKAENNINCRCELSYSFR